MTTMEVFGRPATVVFLTELGGEVVEPQDALLVVVRFDDGSISYLHRPYKGKLAALGGPGSGFHGHAGRPGEVGGSATAGFTAATPEQRKALKLPPAWTDVLVNPDPDAGLQAIGKDAKGRTQYRYSAAHTAEAAARKFARMKGFEETLPSLREQVTRDYETSEAAVVVDLIDKTGFRVGSDQETRAAKKAYGASTLRARHVKVAGDVVTVKFNYPGKKGVQIKKTIKDERIARELSSRLEGKQPTSKLFRATGNDIRDYMDTHAKGFTPKDFRTRHATAMAFEMVKKMPRPKTQKAIKAARKAVGEKVGAFLGHAHGDSGQALASYIDPTVFARWEAR